MSDFSDPRAKWWCDHVVHTRKYVDGILERNKKKAKDALVWLWRGTLKWGNLLKSPVGAALMGEHTVLVKNLVDSAARGLKPNEAEYLTEYLLRNSRNQSFLYGKTIPNFPVEKWSKLFNEHIAHTGKYIVALAGKNMKAFSDEWKKTLGNMKEIAFFSEKHFTGEAPLDGSELEADGMF